MVRRLSPALSNLESARSTPARTVIRWDSTLWFALTGSAPHSGKTLEEIRDRKTRDGLPAAQLIARKVPEPLVKLLRSTLAVDPEKRPASARELMKALQPVAGTLIAASASGLRKLLFAMKRLPER